jgi:hypothetical protein
MSTNLITITVSARTFAVRASIRETIATLASAKYPHIQALICEFFGMVDDCLVDEFALVVHTFFPTSLIVDNRQGRATADVRKYNKRAFAVQDERDDDTHQVRLLDGKARAGGSNPALALEVLKQFETE